MKLTRNSVVVASVAYTPLQPVQPGVQPVVRPARGYVREGGRAHERMRHAVASPGMARGRSRAWPPSRIHAVTSTGHGDLLQPRRTSPPSGPVELGTS